ncbi:MAG: hypothetical protein IT426_16480 [Pirellulales bacterium]|nr:hypothetical protein [Pirellulales bacterium]
MKTRPITLVILQLAVVGFAAACAAGEWLTGPELIERLSDPVDLVWSENPLRDALAAFARVHNVAVLLDRRVDPGRKMTLSVKQSPLSEALAAVAMSGELGVTLAGPVAYFGPAGATPKLRTLIFLREEEARKMPPAAAKMFFRERPLAWNDFAQPREILQRLGRENRLTIVGLERIPYDLWAAADLPPMTLVERLSLVAFQYDLTFSYSANGRRIELVPLPPDVRLPRSYPGGKKPEETAKRFAELAPQAEIEVAGDAVLVKAMLEDHERLEAPPPPAGGATAKNAAPDFSRKRFDLSVIEKPIGPVLKQLAEHLGLQLQMDESAIERAGVSLDQRVSFKVEDATIDELLQAAIEKTPLTYRRQGTILKVEALKKKD